MRAIELPVVLGMLLSTCGCSCDKCSELDLDLPALNSDTSLPMAVEIRQSGRDTVLTTCSWAKSPHGGGSGIWTCNTDCRGWTKRLEDASFCYNTAAAAGSWSITLIGPTSSQVIARNSKINDSGEWPTGCSCDAYDLVVTGADAQNVGATGPDSSPTSTVDAGVDSKSATTVDAGTDAG